MGFPGVLSPTNGIITQLITTVYINLVVNAFIIIFLCAFKFGTWGGRFPYFLLEFYQGFPHNNSTVFWEHEEA